MSLLVAEPVDRLSESFKPCNQTNKKGYLSLDDYRLEVAITVTVLVGIMQVKIAKLSLIICIYICILIHAACYV